MIGGFGFGERGGGAEEGGECEGEKLLHAFVVPNFAAVKTRLAVEGSAEGG